ncbi:hypothetical protein LTR37_000689 [Vermiconidia calcicola]|uniref:Uncharacterized protein n=1 Tax=Vermiconidia calcicola TaxID=1690605 RepID=A0ACC3NYC8_9PEZI|nr:hypothetical protein LTR37_000689 [Vermiconidia calcicola]
MEQESRIDSPQRASRTKRRAACEECRNKKLKCTGEQPRCARCAREDIECFYSVQKPMGRPKKRQRTEEEEILERYNNSNGGAAHGDGGGRMRSSVSAEAAGWDSVRGTAPTDSGVDVGLGGDFDSPFTPGGSLQPWLQVENSSGGGGEGRWDNTLALTEGAVPPNNSSSTNSPSQLILPPELQNQPRPRPRPHPHNHNNHPDTSTALLLGTTNLGQPPSLLPSCACLSTMYLTLSTLQSMDPAFTFPFALHPLREAMQTASDILACTECPQRFISAIQNTQLMGTLLMSIADRFSKILEAITTESLRSSEEKKFRLADLNTSTSHLHTAGLGCAAAFSINLSPAEWRALAKTVVRAEVFGPACCPYFMGIVDSMEKRQEYWHDRPVPEDFPRDRSTGELIGGRNLPKEDHVCLKFVSYARKLVGGMDWS